MMTRIAPSGPITLARITMPDHLLAGALPDRLVQAPTTAPTERAEPAQSGNRGLSGPAPVRGADQDTRPSSKDRSFVLVLNRRTADSATRRRRRRPWPWRRGATWRRRRRPWPWRWGATWRWRRRPWPWRRGATWRWRRRAT